MIRAISIPLCCAEKRLYFQYNYEDNMHEIFFVKLSFASTTESNRIGDHRNNGREVSGRAQEPLWSLFSQMQEAQ